MIYFLFFFFMVFMLLFKIHGCYGLSLRKNHVKMPACFISFPTKLFFKLLNVRELDLVEFQREDTDSIIILK